VISPELIAKALATIGSSPANHEYFFANLRSPDWLEPLRAAGRFKSPARALRDSRGISFVQWPESGYLARMAADKPDLVCDIILESRETDNERVHQDFVEAAIKMTPSAAAAVAKFEAAWIRKQSWLYTLYPEKVGELISHLANIGQVEPALDLARELLMIVPPPEPLPEEDDNVFSRRPEPRGKCNQWEYQQVLSRNIPDLVKAAPERSLRLLADLLEAALRVRSKGQQDETEDYSWIWRPDIESKRFDDFTEALLSATRDASMTMSTSAETSGRAADLLWSRRWRMFRRLTAHTLRKSPTAPIEKVEELLTKPVEYEDFPGHSPEFDKLLTHRFADLSDAGKGKILAFIDRGPDLSGFKKRKEMEGKPATEEEISEVADYWRLQWLHKIRKNLEPSRTETYSTLVARFGAPREDDNSGGIHSWVGPSSPKSADELGQMSGEELISFLKTWYSTGEWNAPSSEGLGRSLSAMLATEPQKLAASATLLRGLEPTYVRSAIEGFTNALKNGQRFDLSPVVELCEWAVAQGNDEKPLQHTMGNDPDWNWTRKSIGWFLNEALKAEGTTVMPLSLSGRVWALLESLAEDPVPAEQERSYERGMFVGSSSLNVTRGVALDGMLQYARWLYKQGAIASEERKLDSIPELKRVFDSHVADDKSIVTREVLGRGFATMFWLDKRWANSTAPAIFREKEKALGDIAFANYLLFCHPYNDLLPVMVPYYRGAVELIGKDYRKEVDEVDRHLVQHLMLLYWHGKIAIDSEDLLIRNFFAKAPSKLRSEAIEFIGRNLHRAQAVKAEILKRLADFWEWRWAELQQHRCDGEPVPFGIWFASGQFDLDWSFDNLLAVLRFCHKAELDFWVVERLAAVSHDRPAAAVEALGMMIEGDQEGWAMHGWQDHPRTVLATALNSTDRRAQKEAKRVIHLVGSRGWYGYRDLLREGRQERAL
jgi:hypothetical protein